MRLFLVVQNEGKQKGMRIPVTGELFLIGRDPECQLRPASTIISKRHCGFLCSGQEFFLEDYKSTNGTILNGNRVDGKVAIKNGDAVSVGPLDFKILIETIPVAPVPGQSKPVAGTAPKSGMMKGLVPPGAAAAKPQAAPTPSAVVASQEVAEPAPAAPVQASRPAAETPSKNALDDDIAALLLGGDDSSGSSPDIAPDSTTVIDMNKDLSETPPSGNPAVRPQTAGKPIASTTDAAKALLEKYMRRPRAT